MWLVALLLLNSAWLSAAGTNQGLVVSDTLVFSLFVVCAIVFLMIIYAQINAVKGILENKELWSDNNKKTTGATEKVTILVFAFLFSKDIFAQAAATPEALVTMTKELYWILIGLNAFLLGIIITLHFVIKGIVSSLRGEEELTEDTISVITASLTDSVPIERESEILMDHNYDGIRELDNNLPPWWKYGFYLTIFFAIVYLIRFHVIGSGPTQLEEYNTEMAKAELEIQAYKASQANQVDESNLMALTESVRLEAGKKVFMDNCKICHGEFGEGMVGPNFTDKYWKNGGGIKNIFNTIKTGVPDKGMISWESQLTPGQMLEVSSYILTLEGTNPANQKAPEGELWEGEAVAPVLDEAVDSVEVISQPETEKV